MPVDPSISLDTVGGGSGMSSPGGGLVPANPLSMLSTAADTMGKLNQLKLFQAEFAAKQEAGEIIASAPDLPTAVATLQKNPRTAMFAPQAAANAVATQNAVLDAQGKIQSQGHDAFSNMVKQLPAVIQDPSQWDALKDTSLNLASPAIKPALSKSFDRLHQSLTDGLSEDPKVAQQQQLQRLSGWAIANGAGEAIPKILGDVTVQNTGGRFQGVQNTPAQGGINGQAPGTLSLGSNALTVGPNPAIVSTPAGGAVAVNPGQGGRLVGPGGGGGGNALAPGAPPVGPVVSRPQAGPGTIPPAAPAAPQPLAGDDTPLVPNNYKFESPSASLPRDLTGFPLRDASSQSAVNSRLDEWNTKGRAQFDNAQNTKGLLAEVTSNYDRLAKGGGFLIPGSGGDMRLNVAKLVNTVSGMTGGAATDLPVDPSKIAAGEDLNKDTWRLGTNAMNLILGSHHEAASTIQGAIGAVPGIENTYFGGKFISSMLGAMADRAIDQRTFENQWQGDPKNGGDLRGSEIEFNRLHPSTDYVNKVLKQYGMNESGFASKEAVRDAFKQGLLTKEQATEILSSKFGGK